MIRALMRFMRRGDPRPTADTPTVEELHEITGYHLGTCTAALRALRDGIAAGRFRCYPYLTHGNTWAWYVTLEHLRETAKPQEYRRELGTWAYLWITGRLPTGPEGGAA